MLRVELCPALCSVSSHKIFLNYSGVALLTKRIILVVIISILLCGCYEGTTICLKRVGNVLSSIFLSCFL